MRRIELIPQTTAAINSGKVFYHFSMARNGTNAPSVNREHQINFFESHFTEMKYGWISGEAGDSDPKLQWMVSQQSKWSVPTWEVGVWHNIAYEIVRCPGHPDKGARDVTVQVTNKFGHLQNFSANTVGLWHSTGADPLTQVVAPVSASTSSNGADWHLGVLELPRTGYADANEDYYFSGVYIESGTITTAVTGPAS